MQALLRAVTIIVAWTMLPAAACAQALPASVDTPHLETPRSSDAARDVPIGSYTLATFWVPQHCKHAIRGIAALACDKAGVRPGGLALHGLWPDGVGKEWPQWCKPAALLAPATIAAHLDATPSAQQMQHEWAKHGTCMAGYTPERYFDRSEQLYRAIHMPDLRALSYRSQTVASVKQAIADANPGLKAEMFKLTLDKGWLEEIWFCLDTKFARATCAEPQREPADARVQIWRGGRGSNNRRYSGGSYNRYDRYRRPRYGTNRSD